jgi:hypothetical protein
MPTRSQQPQSKPQDRVKHPVPIERALNPGVEAVRTRGTPSAQEPRTRPASELKEVVRALSGYVSGPAAPRPCAVCCSRRKLRR